MLKPFKNFLRYGLPVCCLVLQLACSGMTSGNNLTKDGGDSGDHGGGDSHTVGGDPNNINPKGGDANTISGGIVPMSATVGGGDQVVASNSGWQPSTDGHVVRSSLRYAKVIPVGGYSDPDCGSRMSDHTHDVFPEYAPNVAVVRGDSPQGPWENGEDWVTNNCGTRPIFCNHFGENENGVPMMIQDKFAKVFAYSDLPSGEHLESCPQTIDCGQILITGKEYDFKLVSGTPDCNVPPPPPKDPGLLYMPPKF